jgi:trimethylamine:corrinoid methyltransferase-like protein
MSSALRTQTATRPRFGYLSDAAIELLRAKTLSLLEQHGFAINHDEAVARLVMAGAKVEADGITVHFPAGLMEEALRETPKSVSLYGKGGQHRLDLPAADGTFHLRTGTGAHAFIELESGRYRKLMLDDVDTIARLGDELSEVGFIAHPFVNGTPELTSDIHGFARLASRSMKHNWIQPYNAENVEYLHKIAIIVAGGEEAFRKRPCASSIVTSFSPLEIKQMDVEAMIQAARLGMPIHACSLPTAGGTAPVTAPGSVLMAAAEIVAMVTMAHVLGPGTAVIATPLMFALDMRSGRSLQSSVEVLQAASMALQLMKRGFGLMTHTYGSGSDTPDVDAQSQAERALLGLTVGLAEADILGGAGQLECATVFSPLQLVVDNEIVGMIRQYLHTPEITEESLNWQGLLDVRLGGHFLANDHTLQHCRGHFSPEAFVRLAHDSYEASGRLELLANAREQARKLLEREPPDGLPSAEALREIEDVVAAGDRHIVG